MEMTEAREQAERAGAIWHAANPTIDYGVYIDQVTDSLLLKVTLVANAELCLLMAIGHKAVRNAQDDNELGPGLSQCWHDLTAALKRCQADPEHAKRAYELTI